MRGEHFVRTAIVALDEAGDPGSARATLAGLRNPAPLRSLAKPQTAPKLVAWHAERIAMLADDPARAYAQLRELCTTLFAPLASRTRTGAPAPEVALTLAPAALLDALAPAPRVLARDLAVLSELDSATLLVAPRPELRVLGVRSIPSARLGRFADALATRIASDPDPDVRAEALAVGARANDAARTKIAGALAPLCEASDATTRAAALDGMRALKLPLGGAPLVARLADPVAAVRVAALRSVLPASATDDVIARLADRDAAVRSAALDAIARCPALHRPSLAIPLAAIVRLYEGDTRSAVYLLGKIYPRASREEAELIVASLLDALAGPRSDVASAAALVLRQVGVAPPDVPVETRLLRAARELAASDRETQLAGLFEASRLGDAARSLVPAIRRLGDAIAVDPDPTVRATLSQVSDVLAALGVGPGELPRPRVALAPARGATPEERGRHGAYVIAAIDRTKPKVTGLGLWDAATGALLFFVERAELFEILPGRAEAGVLRIAADGTWHFERYAIPTGVLVRSLRIPPNLATGTPSSLVAAADLVTVWCTGYRFHIKLGDRDKLLDDEPNKSRKPKRGSTKLPRRTPPAKR